MTVDLSSPPRAGWDSPCLGKLDKLPWTFGFCVDFDGRYLGVRTDNAEVGRQLLSLAETFGPIVSRQSCDSLVSLKTAKPSARRGVRHYNILYSNHHVLTKSHDLNSALEVYHEGLKLVAVTMRDQLVHIDACRLFAWEADDRLISVVGEHNDCWAVVAGLRPFLMPERTSFTSFCEDGNVAFAPWDLEWRGRLIHHPIPLTDLVLLTRDGAPLSRAQIILRLFELSSGKVDLERRPSLLANALKNVRFHTIEIGDLRTLAQRVADRLDLGVEAIELPGAAALPPTG